MPDMTCVKSGSLGDGAADHALQVEFYNQDRLGSAKPGLSLAVLFETVSLDADPIMYLSVALLGKASGTTNSPSNSVALPSSCIGRTVNNLMPGPNSPMSLKKEGREEAATAGLAATDALNKDGD
ncbi:putative DUF636 domain protein [Teratosphaeria destructans]|uniref:DUF636 domain protein n=1 Tax=Teratosphaeria destructans TaxID=418781 RepID=A0A9W7W6Q6_9PEZI|nr:putative DUF636 domain protein [Teratosphaeria destructans]